MPASFTFFRFDMASSADTFVNAEGQTLSLEFAIEPLVNLRRGAMAAVRIEPVVRHVRSGKLIPSTAFARLSDDDVGVIDRAAATFAANCSHNLSLILPLSFRTMAARRGRAELAAATSGSRDDLKRRIIVELTDIDRGTPAGRMTEVAALVGEIFRGVFARLPAGRDAMAPVQSARLQGLTLDASELAGTDSEAAGLLLEFAAQAKGLAPTLVAQGLPAEGYMAVAEVAGFTHAALRGTPEPMAESYRPEPSERRISRAS